ncbi:MAG TPA: amidohydrolase family protein [Polyangia bacterium]|jgi:predicted TIM-barrel fold metal-dependent hydrolase|nr:amidohydrolase family protein [Polyangia bacterium]
MARFRGPLISADSHVVEEPRLWLDRIDRRYRHLAPRVVDVGDTDLWLVGTDDRRLPVTPPAAPPTQKGPGRPFRELDDDALGDVHGGGDTDGGPNPDDVRIHAMGIHAQAGRRYAPGARISKRQRLADRGDFSPEAYLAGLTVDGVAGAVLYPSVGLGAYQVVPSWLFTPIARTYNDWLLREFCAHAPDRLKGAAMINVDDIDAALAEMTRTAQLGAACFLFPVDPAPGQRYDDRRFEPLWSAAAELGLPVMLHLQAMRSIYGRAPVFDLLRHTSGVVHLHLSLAAMSLSGVFARHPGLRVGAVEWGGSWVPYLLERIDAAYRADHGRTVARLAEGALPSDHLRRALFVIFQEDAAALALRDQIGIERLLWGNDYPHAESTFPRSREILAAQLDQVASEDAARFTFKNAAERFGFVLERLVASKRRSPQLKEQATPGMLSL